MASVPGSLSRQQQHPGLQALSPSLSPWSFTSTFLGKQVIVTSAEKGINVDNFWSHNINKLSCLCYLTYCIVFWYISSWHHKIMPRQQLRTQLSLKETCWKKSILWHVVQTWVQSHCGTPLGYTGSCHRTLTCHSSQPVTGCNHQKLTGLSGRPSH